MIEETDLLIIGAGPVGIFTAFQGGIMGMKSIVVDSLNEPGGQCSSLYPEKPIYDIPGHPSVSGLELVKQLLAQASRFNPKYHFNTTVTQIHKDSNAMITTSNTGKLLKSKAIIVAAGNGLFVPQKPQLENICNFENKTLFYSVDTVSRFKNKIVAIAGGGDSAIDWALILTKEAKKIFLIHRRTTFKCLPGKLTALNELISQKKIELLTPYQIKKIGGTNGNVEHIDLESKTLPDTTKNVDLLLMCFGLKNNLGPIKDFNFNIENNKIIVNPRTLQTNIDNIYAVGDIAKYENKVPLISVGFAEAVVACNTINKTLNCGKAINFQHSTNNPVFS